MRTQNSSRTEKIHILKRLVRKFSSSELTRTETMSVLNRLVYKLSSISFSGTDILVGLRRKWKEYYS